MGAKRLEPDRIPLSDLIEPELVTGLAIGVLAIVAILPKLLAFPAILAAAWYGYSRTQARRNDLAFLIEYFGLRRELEEIEKTRAKILSTIRSLTDAGARGPIAKLPEQLEAVSDKAYTFALALKRLEDGRQLADVDGELRELDRRLDGSRQGGEREHLEKARSHLIRERMAVLKLDELRRRLEAQLLGIYQFLQSADTEVRAYSARYLAGRTEDSPEIMAETKDLLDSVQDVDAVLAELEQQSVERRIEAAASNASGLELVESPVDPADPVALGLDRSAVLGAALARLGVEEDRRCRSSDTLEKLLGELESAGGEATHLRRLLMERMGQIAAEDHSPVDRREFFLEMIGAAIEDGRVDPEENRFLVKLAGALGLERSDCDALARQAKKEYRKQRVP